MRTEPTGNGHETVETGQPEQCPAGHPLRPPNLLVAYGIRPDGERARSWQCKTCWAIEWDWG